MLIARFLKRLSQENADRRAEIVRILARVYIEVPLDTENRASAETALTAILDDPAARVRAALADALADSQRAPRPVIRALADDHPDVARHVLSRSPVLMECELIDIVATGGSRACPAIAARSDIGAVLADALLTTGDRNIWLMVLANSCATIAESTYDWLAGRCHGDPGIRNALLERTDLPVNVRQKLVDGLSDALGELVMSRNWLSPERTKRLVCDARDRSILEISASSPQGALRSLVAMLVADDRVTPALLIRALSLGNMRFVEESFAALADLPTWRVRSLLEDRGGRGLTALYQCSGLPKAALPAFRSMLDVMRDEKPDGSWRQRARMGQRMLERASTCPRSVRHAEAGELFSLLDRLAAEAAREEARDEAGGYFRAA